ncbi:MAG: MarR family transcriptional regulator [Actinobacteria bacterium]|nr:MarR family transcriptional regulator [Actinomycetota bacterium]
MAKAHEHELIGLDRRAVAGLFDSTSRLVFSWTARPVTQQFGALAGLSLEPIEYLVLRHIRVHGPLRLGELASRANMTPSNASKIVTELVEEGLVARQVPNTDRRVTMLELTDAGADAAARLERAGVGMLAERLAGFSPEEVDELYRLLARLADEVESWCGVLSREAGGPAVATEGGT